jgi:hypothetical protein
MFAVTSNQRTLQRKNVVHSSLNLVTLITEAIYPSETWFLKVPQDVTSHMTAFLIYDHFKSLDYTASNGLIIYEGWFGRRQLWPKCGMPGQTEESHEKPQSG